MSLRELFGQARKKFVKCPVCGQALSNLYMALSAHFAKHVREGKLTQDRANDLRRELADESFRKRK
jgi:hypothetical protein